MHICEISTQPNLVRCIEDFCVAIIMSFSGVYDLFIELTLNVSTQAFLTTKNEKKWYLEPIPQAFLVKEIKSGILQHVGNDLTLQQCQGRTFI